MKGPKNIVEMQVYPVHEILIRLSWPVVVSLLAQSLYSFIDGVFLARLGDEVLSAVSLSFTVQKFIMMFFTGLATGMNAVISKSIGEGNYKKAKDAMLSGVVTQLAFALVITIASFWFVPFYFHGCAGTQQVCEYGVSYLLPCVGFVVFSSSQIVFERILQSSGLSRHMLVCQIVGSLINIILDPILIFGMGRFCGFGIAGAAYATVLGQFAATAMALVLNLKCNRLLFEELRESRFRWGLVGSICYIGIPSTAVGMASCVSAFYVNDILISFSPTANASYGIYAKLENLILVIGQGFSAGMVTVLSFFIGKRDYSKMRKCFLTGEIIVFSWMAFCTLMFNLMPRILLIPFGLTENMVSLTIPAMRIVGLSYLSSGILIGVSAFFQSIGKSIYSLLTAVTKQLLVRIPVALWLARFGNVNLIWWCWPISEILSGIISLIIFFKLYRKTKEDLCGKKNRL